MTQVIKMDEPFIIRVTMKHDAVRESKFKIFMQEEGFQYQIITGYEYSYFNISCDNLVDGAKIETYLSTEPWTPSNIIQ